MRLTVANFDGVFNRRVKYVVGGEGDVTNSINMLPAFFKERIEIIGTYVWTERIDIVLSEADYEDVMDFYEFDDLESAYLQASEDCQLDISALLTGEREKINISNVKIEHEAWVYDLLAIDRARNDKIYMRRH